MRFSRLMRPAMVDISLGAKRCLCLAIGFSLPGLSFAQAQTASVSPEQTQPEPAKASAPVAPAASKGYPLEAQGWGAKQSGNMWQVRWAEDWSYLKDPSKRKSLFDPLKYIPLNESGKVYVSLSNELRARSNTITNLGLLPGSYSQQQYLFRAFFGADLHVGEHFRLYTELAHSSLDGRNEGTKTGTQENNAILQQVFFDVKGRVAGTDLGLRVGRQVFVDGPTTLMALRDNTDIFVTLNGVRAWAIGEKTRVDVFDFSFNLDGTEGLGDDRIDRSRHLRGVVGGYRLPTAKPIYLEPFFYQYRNDNHVWGRQTAEENRNYYGLRLWGNVGKLRTDSFLTMQRGSFGGRDLRAYMASTSNAWSLSETGWKPRLGFHSEIASGGGGTSGTGTLRNNNFLYGNTIYFSWATFFGPVNLVTAASTFTLEPLNNAL
ncbi:alginate export family protein, partial [Xanthomonas fragariae]|uniref:alginate export family protein n=2 Tax=Xanthomonas fragariae TaxID=48664 RepID=UPI000D560CBA